MCCRGQPGLVHWLASITLKDGAWIFAALINPINLGYDMVFPII